MGCQGMLTKDALTGQRNAVAKPCELKEIITSSVILFVNARSCVYVLRDFVS